MAGLCAFVETIEALINSIMVDQLLVHMLPRRKQSYLAASYTSYFAVVLGKNTYRVIREVALMMPSMRFQHRHET